MNVLIIDLEGDEIIADYPISLRRLGYTPSEREYFDLAGDAVVEDSVVDESGHSNYKFQLSEHSCNIVR